MKATIHIEQKWAKSPSGIGCFSLLLNAADESEKKPEIRGIYRKKRRGRSGRIREKAGNQGHRLEGKLREERTNQRKSRKSGALARRKAGGEADESEKKPEIRGIGQKKSRRKNGRIKEKTRNQGRRLEEKPEEKRTNQRKNRKSGASDNKAEESRAKFHGRST